MPQTLDRKSCAHCSATFYRRRNERPNRWRERRFCSRECVYRSRWLDSGLPPCLKCGREGGFKRIRGICNSCYSLLVGTDALLDYPRSTMPIDLVWEEWSLLKAQGLTNQEVADKLGMTYAALDRSLCRYRAKLKKNQEITA